VWFLRVVEDTFSALQNGQAGLPQNQGNQRPEFNALQPESVVQQTPAGHRTAGLGRSFTSAFAVAANGRANRMSETLPANVITRYCATAALVAGLGARYGVRWLFF
jgi:hypothetical protein